MLRANSLKASGEFNLADSEAMAKMQTSIHVWIRETVEKQSHQLWQNDQMRVPSSRSEEFGIFLSKFFAGQVLQGRVYRNEGRTESLASEAGYRVL